METKRRYQGSIPFQEPDCKYLLLYLWSVIHRDNGHYTAEHGVEKAVEHAKKVLLCERELRNDPEYLPSCERE